LLRLVYKEEKDINKYIKTSFLNVFQMDMENQTKKELEEVEKVYTNIKDICRTNKISNNILEEYIELSKDVLTFTNKKLKEANKRRCEVIDMYPTIEFEKRNNF
jgi:hypothetical protein